MNISTLERLLWLIFKLSVLVICIDLLLNKTKLGHLQKTLNGVFGIKPPPPAPIEAEQGERIFERAATAGDGTADPVLGAVAGPSAMIRDGGTQGKRRIGQILLEQKLITPDVLDKALQYQQQHGGTLTQYLLHNGHIDEKQLAQCLCEQFRVPYLPIHSYDIPDEVLNLIPTDIVEKYWILPLEKTGDALTVAMIDPLDANAIKELEALSGLRIMPMVGMISEILAALQTYYKIFLNNNAMTALPFFVQTATYAGKDRRRAVRYPARIDIQFPADGAYVKAQTQDISRQGFCFNSPRSLTLGTVITVELDLPRDASPWPIAVVAKVVRCVPREQDNFALAVEILKTSKEEMDCIINYALAHRVE